MSAPPEGGSVALRATVVIAALDAADTIERQLAALAAQDAPFAFEVVVADNGSTDATRAIVADWQGRIPSLRLADASAQRGAGFARNRGAAGSGASVIAFCDADDAVDPGWLAAIVPAAERSGLATGPVRLFEWTEDDHRRLRLEVPFGFLPTAPTANLAIRRDVFESLGGFTTAFAGAGGEDADLCWRAQLAGAELALEPAASIRYHVRSTRRGRLERLWHYEQCNARLYVMFREHGMQRPSALVPLKRLGWVLTHPHLVVRDERVRDRVLGWLVAHTSRLVASIRLRTVFP